jgi:hypothetical protein
MEFRNSTEQLEVFSVARTVLGRDGFISFFKSQLEREDRWREERKVQEEKSRMARDWFISDEKKTSLCKALEAYLVDPSEETFRQYQEASSVRSKHRLSELETMFGDGYEIEHTESFVSFISQEPDLYLKNTLQESVQKQSITISKIVKNKLPLKFWEYPTETVFLSKVDWDPYRDRYYITSRNRKTRRVRDFSTVVAEAERILSFPENSWDTPTPSPPTSDDE